MQRPPVNRAAQQPGSRSTANPTSISVDETSSEYIDVNAEESSSSSESSDSESDSEADVVLVDKKGNKKVTVLDIDADGAMLTTRKLQKKGKRHVRAIYFCTILS